MEEKEVELGPFDKIQMERRRQELLVERKLLPITLADPECDDHFSMTVMMEELGEVAKELQRNPRDWKALETEVVQLAACCVAYLEKLDKLKKTMGFSL